MLGAVHAFTRPGKSEWLLEERLAKCLRAGEAC